MKLLYALALSAFFLTTAQAEELTFAPVPASQVVLADILFVKRPVVVFADSPNDPNFIRQMELLGTNLSQLAERDVILITDTNPADKTEIRQRLRPRGFSLVLMEKDGKAVIRKPLPWDLREITNAIDKFPLRRIEMQERHPSGR